MTTMRRPMTVNRSLADPALDDADHALGRPPNPLKESYRNYYSTDAASPLADQMRASPWWEEGRPINGGRSAIFHVTDAGRKALADHLHERLLAKLRGE